MPWDFLPLRHQLPSIFIMNQEQSENSTPWKVLTMEGLVSLNKLTEAVLKDITFMQRPVSILTATSCDQGTEILERHPDIALLLFDVALEKEPSKLDFINFIRHKKNNISLRILLYLDHSELTFDEVMKKKLNVQGCLLKDRHLKEKLLPSVLNEFRNYNEIEFVTQNLRSLGGSIAHELRNPLASVSMGCSAVESRLEKYKQALDTLDARIFFMVFRSVKRSIKNANFIIDMILQNIMHREVDSSCFDHFSVRECITETIDLYPFHNHKERNYLTTNLQDDFIVWGSKELLQFALFNLLKNSLSALVGKSNRQIRIKLETGDRHNRLFFYDSGRGIAHDKLPHIFDAFVTEGKRGGTGLGLPFCKRVIEGFGADIACSSIEGKHTEFILKFPQTARPSTA